MGCYKSVYVLNYLIYQQLLLLFQMFHPLYRRSLSWATDEIYLQCWLVSRQFAINIEQVKKYYIAALENINEKNHHNIVEQPVD